MKTLHSCVASIPGLGRLRLMASDAGLRAIDLGVRAADEPSRQPLLREALGQLGAYAAGRLQAFDLPLDPDWGSPFRRRVLEALLGVPWGATTSYGELAGRTGCPGGARAVGGAVGANPLAIIIPCHRVLAADGRLGGFSGGLDWKRRLLALEGIPLPRA